jgi:hypothetical protein
MRSSKSYFQELTEVFPTLEVEVKFSISFVSLLGHIVSDAPGHFENFNGGICHVLIG